MSSMRSKRRSTAKQMPAASSVSVAESSSSSVAISSTPDRLRDTRVSRLEESQDLSAAAISSTPDRLRDTRVSRLEESQELQSLNKRLELYIVKQREKEAGDESWKKEYENLRVRYNGDLEKIQSLYEEDVKALRSIRDEQADMISQLEVERVKLSADCTEMKKAINTEKEFTKYLQARMDEQGKELVTLRTTNFKLTEECASLRADRGVDKLESERLKKEVSAAMLTAKQMSTKLNHSEVRVRDLEDESRLSRVNTEKQIAAYQEQLSVLRKQSEKSLATMRAEHERKIDTMFEERYVESHEEKELALQEMKEEYDEKVDGYRAALEALGHQMEEQKNATKEQMLAIKRLSSQLDEANERGDTLLERVEEQELVIDRYRRGESLIVEEKNATIRQIKDAFKQKDSEFDELMDVKVGLGLEIKAMRSLLEAEEKRIGVVAKRHGGKSSANALSPSSSSPSASSSSLSSTSSSFTSEATTTNTPATSWSSTEARSARSSKRKRGVAQGGADDTDPNEHTDTHMPVDADADLHSPHGDVLNAESLLISGVDHDGQYVKIANRSVEDSFMKGWKLLVTAHDAREFTVKLPSKVLKAGGIIVLRPTANCSEGNHDAELPTGSWEAHGSRCDLVNPEKETVASVSFRPAASDSSANAVQKCVVM